MHNMKRNQGDRSLGSFFEVNEPRDLSQWHAFNKLKTKQVEKEVEYELNLKYITTLLVLTIFLSACNNGVKPKEHLVEIYSEALTSIMEQDEGLNGDMKYIAIDMSNFDEVSDSEKKEILKYFKGEYKVEVMDAT